MISSYFSSINFLLWPKIAPFKKIFSLPVKSGSNPAPNSINGAIAPLTETFPMVGSRTPAIIFSNVLFPEPLEPIRAKESPLEILKEISFKAQKSSLCILCETFLRKYSFKLSTLSEASENFIETFSTSIAYLHTIISLYIQYKIFLIFFKYQKSYK